MNTKIVITDKMVNNAFKVYGKKVGLDRTTNGLLRAMCLDGLRAVLENFVKEFENEK